MQRDHIHRKTTLRSALQRDILIARRQRNHAHTAKRLVCLPLGASPLLLSMYHKPGSARFAVTEGLDAEADAVEGRASTAAASSATVRAPVIIGQQFEEYNPIPGPLYAGGGYTAGARSARAM